MTNKYIFLILFLISHHLHLSAQDINWKESTEWRLYKVSGSKGLRIRRDSLVNYSSILLNEDTVQNFLKGVANWPKEKNAAWMGANYASCVINGEIHKINISMYGGFFYDEFLHTYFQIASDKTDEWLNWISSVKKKTKSWQ